MFINRKKELDILDAYQKYIHSGKQIHLTLFGLRRMGKTELLLKFKEEYGHKGLIIPYLNIQKIVPDLNNFSKQFLIELLYESVPVAKRFDKPSTWDDLLVFATRVGEMEGTYLLKVSNILSRRTVDESAVLDLVFSFPEKIAEKHHLKIIYIIDEFQEILQIQKNILRIMRAITEKQKHVNYWVSGSVFTVFEELFGYKNPFFGQFKKITLSGFDRGSSHELIDWLLPLRLDAVQKNILHDFSGGQPYYLTAICERIIQEYAIQKDMNRNIVKYCILQELFGETGKINEHFEYLMDVSLAKFTNKDLYKKMLLYLSQQPDTLSGISQHMNMPSGEMSSYMKHS
ncbi:MAG: ATP-binding protein [Euryarchaeota archaeon]|nr:ATP-binding protein [Euryarchaeota archaeon]